MDYILEGLEEKEIKVGLWSYLTNPTLRSSDISISSPSTITSGPISSSDPTSTNSSPSLPTSPENGGQQPGQGITNMFKTFFKWVVCVSVNFV